jgi:hypothetical protein
MPEDSVATTATDSRKEATQQLIIVRSPKKETQVFPCSSPYKANMGFSPEIAELTICHGAQGFYGKSIQLSSIALWAAVPGGSTFAQTYSHNFWNEAHNVVSYQSRASPLRSRLSKGARLDLTTAFRGAE